MDPTLGTEEGKSSGHMDSRDFSQAAPGVLIMAHGGAMGSYQTDGETEAQKGDLIYTSSHS
jgi:hypothetical protein